MISDRTCRTLELQEVSWLCLGKEEAGPLYQITEMLAKKKKTNSVIPSALAVVELLNF